jgi:hypothetical protein
VEIGPLNMKLEAQDDFVITPFNVGDASSFDDVI